MRAPLFALASLAIFFVTGSVRADALEDWLAKNETTCVGSTDEAIAAPAIYDVGGYHYEVRGSVASVTAAAKTGDKGGQIKLGILNAIKDLQPETKENLDQFVARFKEAGVSAIVVDGDTAFEESEMADIFGRLGETNLPVLAVIGNSESRGEYNRGALAAWKTHHNVLNMDFVRRVDLPGLTLVSLPGYYDKRFLHDVGGCVYKPEDAEALVTLAKGAKNPVVLVSHGPPKMAGKSAIDFASNAGNIGDEAMTKAITQAKIAFGVHGHVLEAGGRGTDLSGKSSVKPGTFAKTLFVNPGPANSLPWKMNQGADSHGMAMVLTIAGGKAKYELLRAPDRVKKL